MATIVTRAGKGVPLTNNDADNNFINLNTDKLEINAALGTPASVTLTNATGLPTAGLVDNAVTDPKLRDSAGLSVMGRGANSTGDPADIVAGTNKQVLRRDGSSLAFGAVDLASNQAVTGTLPVNQGGTGITSFGTGVAAFLGTPSSANLAGALTDETGSGAAVFATNATLVNPALGTPASGVATNLTGTAAGLTAGNVTTNANLTGAITSTGNATLLGSFTSANLAAAVTNETGTGALVFATFPTLVSPALGTPHSGVVTNLTGTASININGTVGATTASTGAFTTLAASSPASFAAGTAALPSITRTGDTNTGMFFPAADTIAAAVGGAEAMRLDSSGNVLATGGFIPTNTSRLVVRGFSAGGYNNTFSQENATAQIISNKMGNDAWNPTLNITMVRQSLTTGSLSFGGIGFSTIDDSNNTGMFDAGRIAIVNNVGAVIASGTAMAFYTQAGSSTPTNAAEERLRITSAGNVGIGTTAPGTYRLNAARNSTGDGGQIAITSAGGAGFVANPLNLDLDFLGFSNGVTARIRSIDQSANVVESILSFSVRSAANTLVERLRIDSAGNVGIGTSAPAAKLVVSGSNQAIHVFDTGANGAFLSLGASNTETTIRSSSTVTSQPLVFKIGNTEQFRLTATDGFLRMASGTGGIQFNGDTAAANALDDYEQGSFTPTMLFDGDTGITYQARAGRYTKIGQVVNIELQILGSNNLSVTGAVTIGGLPFAGLNDSFPLNGFGFSPESLLSITGGVSARLVQNTTTLALFQNGTGAVTQLTNANIDTNFSGGYFSFSYITA